MTDQEGFEQIVLLFEDDGGCVDSEMLFSDFEALANSSHPADAGILEGFAERVVNAVYALVGAGLSVRGMVFFQFEVDKNGCVSNGFNLPLEYLLEQAGLGPDLGMGAVRMASRGQCPVPWHAVNLWEPHGEGEKNSAMLVQKAVWRNRLSLKASGVSDAVDDWIELVAYGDDEPAASGRIPSAARRARMLENKLTETFGEDGKVGVTHLIHQQSEQVARISEKYRTDLETQQQTYLTQIRGHKDEIQKLKSLLRNEQKRSQHLQAMLRGEVP